MHCFGQSNHTNEEVLPLFENEMYSEFLTQCNSHDILWNKLCTTTMCHYFITNAIFETYITPFLLLLTKFCF